MWNLKNGTEKVIYKQKQNHRCRKQTSGYQGERGKGIDGDGG